jgi:aminoglycoside phosphotransferase (APT) family kinase protein
VKRDLDQLRASLERWLRAQLTTDSVNVGDLRMPKAGYSNETVLGRAGWTQADGTGCTRQFVLRVQPTDHQVFVEPDAIRQAQVMQHLAGLVPVPGVWLTEPDSSVLGAPFYLMDLVEGRVPSDLPSWHKRGWTAELSPRERGQLYDNALASLATLHGIDWSATLAFLEPPGAGTPLDRYLAHVAHWHEWCKPVLRFDTDVIDVALERVLSTRPSMDRTGVVWGDARVGNVVFADDMSVAAMLDWEGATVGPPEIDVGWWLMFEEFLCEAQGLPRLEGVRDREATIERYEELVRRPLVNIRYFEILAGLVFALINSRIADLLIKSGQVAPSVASEYVTRVTSMTAQWLA